MRFTLKCLTVINSGWTAYFQEHGCTITRGELPDETEYDEVIFPSGTLQDDIPLIGMLEL